MKICTKCKLLKELAEFPKHTQTLDGHTGHCKICEKEKRLSVRYEVTLLKRKCNCCKKIKNSEDFAKNPRYIGGLHTWCKECSNSTRVQKNYHIQSNQNKKERMRVDSEYRKKINEQKRTYSRLNFKKVMIANAKRRAFKKNLDFNLTLEDISIPELCPILKIPFIIGTKSDYERTPSLDRIDNNLGYTKSNVQIITKKANSMKNSATSEELLLFANWILKNYK
jgi:hypothetical protein